MLGGAEDGAPGQKHENAWVCFFMVVQLKPGILQGLEGKGTGGFRVADGKNLLSKTCCQFCISELLVPD